MCIRDRGTIDVGGMSTWAAGGEDRSPRMAQVRQAQLNDLSLIHI